MTSWSGPTVAAASVYLASIAYSKSNSVIILDNQSLKRKGYTKLLFSAGNVLRVSSRNYPSFRDYDKLCKNTTELAFASVLHNTIQ